MSTVTVQIPEEALTLAGLDDQPVSERARQLVALELFREGRASLGRAAELAGQSLEAFMEFSAQRQIPLHYTAEVLEQDHETAAHLKL
jgi:predicted HTH domain antitoxin